MPNPEEAARRAGHTHSGRAVRARKLIAGVRNLPRNLFYQCAGIVFKNVHLPPGAFSDALDRFILVCVDAIILERNERGRIVVDDEGYPVVWLAQRNVRPAKNMWWVVGGARRPGNDALTDIEMNWLRETRAQVEMWRFVYLLGAEYIWTDRAQEPTEKPCHIFADTYGVALTMAEIVTVGARLDPNEYASGLVRFTHADLLGDGFHAMLAPLVEKAREMMLAP